METSQFTISGNFWLFLLLSIIAVGIVVFSYRKTTPEISKFQKIILITLRSVGLIVILLLLFSPKFVKSNYKEIPPRLAILLDNSSSAAIKDNSINRKEVYRNLMNQIDFTKFKGNYDVFSFDSKSRQIDDFTFDSLKFKGQGTDIYSPIVQISKLAEERNYQSILLITDGAVNTNFNPIYALDKFAKPIYTIGLGDTLPPKDISIKSLILNEIAYINSNVQVLVQITASGYDNQPVRVEFYEDDKFVEAQEFDASKSQNEYAISFNYEPKTEGIHKITVAVPEKENEYTTNNNQQNGFIKVIKNKKVISIFASSPSADLAFIQQFLSQDKDIKINQFVQKQQGNFYELPKNSDYSETQLFILIDFPSITTPENVVSNIATQLSSGKPFLFIGGNNIDRRKLNILKDYLPFDINSFSNREFKSLVVPNEDIAENPLMRIDGINNFVDIWKQLPPIFKTETFVSPKLNAKVLAYSQIENVKLNEPLIILQEAGNSRSVAVLGYGLHRWKLVGYAKEKAIGNDEVIDVYENFMKNTIRWLSISELDKQIVVKTTKKSYSTSEEIEFVGNVYDNSLNPIDNAQIQINIKNKNINKLIDMYSVGNGTYTAKIPPLPKEDYYFSAKVVYNNSEIGNTNGRFSVGTIDFEMLDLTMNKNLLEQIANLTNGKFYFANNINNLEENIINAKSFKKVGKTINSEIDFINKWWLMGIIILLFATEWYIRKRLSLL